MNKTPHIGIHCRHDSMRKLQKGQWQWQLQNSELGLTCLWICLIIQKLLFDVGYILSKFSFKKLQLHNEKSNWNQAISSYESIGDFLTVHNFQANSIKFTATYTHETKQNRIALEGSNGNGLYFTIHTNWHEFCVIYVLQLYKDKSLASEWSASSHTSA